LKGEVKVSDHEGKSEVVWSGDMPNSDKETSMMLSSIYKMALDGLKKLTED